MQTQAGKKKHLTTKVQSNRWRTEMEVAGEPLGVPPKAKPKDLFVLNEWQSCSEPSWYSPGLLMMGKVSSCHDQWAPLLATLPFCQALLSHCAKMPPTLQTVFPNSTSHLENTCSPSVSGQLKRTEGVNHFSSVTISRPPQPRSKTTFESASRPPVGRHLSTHRRGGWLA